MDQVVSEAKEVNMAERDPRETNMMERKSFYKSVKAQRRMHHRRAMID